jgi:polyisoprenoid-binding protein YceI
MRRSSIRISWSRMMAIGLFLSFGLIVLIAFIPQQKLQAEIRSPEPSPPVSNLAATERFVLSPRESKFMARAYAGGLLWFKGHDHHLAAREFSGEVELTPQTIAPASLRLVVKADSLVETGEAFTPAQKEIINKEVRELVLQPDQYPEIIFQSTSATSKDRGNGQYDVKLTGDLTLHGVSRTESIPVRVTLNGGNLRAVGDFTIDRSNYKVKATSAFHGLVRVRNKVKFEFDIVGHRAR